MGSSNTEMIATACSPFNRMTPDGETRVDRADGNDAPSSEAAGRRRVNMSGEIVGEQIISGWLCPADLAHEVADAIIRDAEEEER